MALSLYAYTERYVVPGGAGGATGLDFANAFDLAGMVADLAPGRRYNLAGAFTSTVIDTSGVSGTNSAPIMFRGWKADLSAVASAFDDMPDIDFTTGAGAGWTIAPYQIFQGLHGHDTQGGPGWNSATADFCQWDLCRVESPSSGGIVADADCSVTNCLINDYAGTGIDLGVNATVFGNHVITGQIAPTAVDIDADAFVMFNFIRDTFGGRIDGITSTSGTKKIIAFNTIDNLDIGIRGSFGVEGVFVIGNQITNCTTGLNQQNRSGIVLFNNFFGNTADDNSWVTYLDRSNTFVDPQYVNISNNDYQIQNTDLIGVSAPPLAGSFNIGAWQQGGEPVVIVGGGNGGFIFV
jgi:hypothetical protein